MGRLQRGRRGAKLLNAALPIPPGARDKTFRRAKYSCEHGRGFLRRVQDDDGSECPLLARSQRDGQRQPLVGGRSLLPGQRQGQLGPTVTTAQR